jgi:superfamily II DNA helicase RecQ
MKYLMVVIPFRESVDPDFDNTNGFLYFGDKEESEHHWDTSHQSKIMGIETARKLGVRLTTNPNRHLQTVLNREFIRVGVNEEYEDSDSEAEDDVNDLQASHSTRTAETKYGRARNLSRDTLFQKYRQVSDKTAEWVNFQPRPSRTQFTPATTYMERQQEAPVAERVEAAMSRLYGQRYTYKSDEQREALWHVVDGRHTVICILPTGGGKTTLITVPAIDNPDKTSIVVSPYVALADDLASRLNDHGVECIRWKSGIRRAATIVVVVIDTVVRSTEFKSYVNDLTIQGRLERIFFDEAHTVLTESHFRPSLLAIKDLAIDAQWIFMTATLPPMWRNNFLTAVGLDNDNRSVANRSSVRWIRSSTVRKNISYKVSVSRDDAIETDVIEYVGTAAQGLAEGEKIIVFGRTVADVRHLAKGLNCYGYHSHGEGKDEQLEIWKKGTVKVIAATTALGAGLDVEKVRLTVHCGKPWKTTNFIQESGRLGRGGEIGTSMTFVTQGEMEQDRDKINLSPEAIDDDTAISHFILGDMQNGCRRIPLNMFNDQLPATNNCISMNATPCDNCEPVPDQQKRPLSTASAITPGAHPPTTKRVRSEDHSSNSMSTAQFDYHTPTPPVTAQPDLRRSEQVRIARQESAQIQHELIQWRDASWGTCLECAYRRRPQLEGDHHDVRTCPFFKWGECLPGNGPRSGLNFAPHSCCFQCAFPGDMCPQYSSKTGPRCKRERDIVRPLVFMPGTRQMAFEIANEMAGRSWTFESGTDKLEYEKWLVGVTMVWGTKATNLFRVFLEVYRRVGRLDRVATRVEEHD